MRVVLVVDDDPVSVQLLDIILARSGYEVLKATNAADGFEIVARHKPDVVIIDDMMPEVSGGEMCRHIKDDSETKDIPVILISAGNRVKNPTYLASVGADYALLKPATAKDLLTAVKAALKD